MKRLLSCWLSADYRQSSRKRYRHMRRRTQLGVRAMIKPKSAAQRMREKRARDKLREEERLDKLLAKTIKLQLFHGTNEVLDRLLIETGIDEPQDVITRLIHGAQHLTPEQKKAIFS